MFVVITIIIIIVIIVIIVIFIIIIIIIIIVVIILTITIIRGHLWCCRMCRGWSSTQLGSIQEFNSIETQRFVLRKCEKL
jgi:hypothetical protein